MWKIYVWEGAACHITFGPVDNIILSSVMEQNELPNFIIFIFLIFRANESLLQMGVERKIAERVSFRSHTEWRRR